MNILTDHPILTHFTGDVRAFTEGFLIDKINTSSCLPILVTISSAHIDRVWTIDSQDCYTQAVKLFPSIFNDNSDHSTNGRRKDEGTGQRDLSEVSVPPGIILVFRLKSSDIISDRDYGNKNDDDVVSSGSCDRLNPLEKAMPLVGLNITHSSIKAKTSSSSLSLSTTTTTSPNLCNHIAFFIKSDGRSSVAFSTAVSYWRKAMVAHDILEYKGVDSTVDMPLPSAILSSFLAYLDDWSYHEGVAVMVDNRHNTNASSANNSSTTTITTNIISSYQSLLHASHSFAKYPTVGLPGQGLLSMR